MDKLCIVDIICHGVPAPNIWRDYLAYIEQKQKMEAVAVNFRDKSTSGWASHQETFIFKKYIVVLHFMPRIFRQSIMVSIHVEYVILHFTNASFGYYYR